MDRSYIRLLERLKQCREIHEDTLDRIVELYCGLDPRTKGKYYGWLQSRNYISKQDNGVVRVHHAEIRRFLQAVEDINHDDATNKPRGLHVNSPKTERKTSEGVRGNRGKRPAGVRRRNRRSPALDHKLRYTKKGRVRATSTSEEGWLDNDNKRA